MKHMNAETSSPLGKHNSCDMSNKCLYQADWKLYNRSHDMLVIDKSVIFKECNSFSQASRLLGPLLRNLTNGELYFPTIASSLQDIHLIMRYAPRIDSEGGINLSITTSYLMSKNLQLLTPEQRQRTRITVFLSQQFDLATYSRFSSWLCQIFQPYVVSMAIIKAPSGNQNSWEFAIDYIKRNPEITLETIIFQLEDDYVCESDMLRDTIEFFASHNPCFVHPTDYPDRYTLPINDDDKHITVVAGRTRIWRSITSSTVSYACRLKCLIAFEDILFQPKNDWANSQLIRKLGGSATIFSAIPSHCAHVETVVGSHISPEKIKVVAFYKNWWKMIQQALTDSQNHPSCPITFA